MFGQLVHLIYSHVISAIVEIPDFYYFTSKGALETEKGCWWYIDANGDIKTKKVQMS